MFGRIAEKMKMRKPVEFGYSKNANVVFGPVARHAGLATGFAGGRDFQMMPSYP